MIDSVSFYFKKFFFIQCITHVDTIQLNNNKMISYLILEKNPFSIVFLFFFSLPLIFICQINDVCMRCTSSKVLWISSFSAFSQREPFALKCFKTIVVIVAIWFWFSSVTDWLYRSIESNQTVGMIIVGNSTNIRLENENENLITSLLTIDKHSKWLQVKTDDDLLTRAPVGGSGLSHFFFFPSNRLPSPENAMNWLAS